MAGFERELSPKGKSPGLGGMNYSKKTRLDKFGNPIRKRTELTVTTPGQSSDAKPKKRRVPQKVAFADHADKLYAADQQILSEVVYVESYKRFN